MNATLQTLVSQPTLSLTNRSHLARFGVKGPAAAQWLAEQNIPIPDRPNSWLPLSEGGLVARLGLTEFLVEDSVHSSIAPHLSQRCEQPPAKVYPVLRQDLAIALHGNALPDLLLQTCNINFRALSLNENPVILTTMIGVTVVVIPGEQNNQPFYRIWCDNTFGSYFWRTLVEVASDFAEVEIGELGARSQEPRVKGLEQSEKYQKTL